MSGLSRREKAAIAVGATVVLTAAASSASVQHHPFSELFPPDQNLDFGGQNIQNVSQLETGTVIPNQSDIVFRDSGGVEILRWNYSSNQWDFNNSEIDTNGNNITSSGGEMCIGEYC